MPPFGDYLIHIAPAAARVRGKQTMTKNTPTLLAFSMAMTIRWYIAVHIAQQRRSRASLEATGCCHWASIIYNNIKVKYHYRFIVVFFIVNKVKMGEKQKDGPYKQ
jgi:hypothetical protein